MKIAGFPRSICDGRASMNVRNPFSSLRRAARNSPWFVISVLAHSIVLILLGLVVMKRVVRPLEDAGRIAVMPHRDAEPPPEVVQLPEPIDRSLIPPLNHGEVIDETMIAPPDTLFAPPDVDLTKPLGDPTSTELLSDGLPTKSTAIGVGTGGIRGYGPGGYDIRPHPPGKGIPPGRLPLGPTFEIDRSVRLGLIWLCRHQNADGSWSARGLRDRCDAKAPCFDPKLAPEDRLDVGTTSLAILCFLGAGFDHRTDLELADSVRNQRHKIGEVVKRGLEWLRARQSADGSFSTDKPFMYNEALATMAMSEAYGLSGARFWREPARRGIDCIQRAQRPNPSGTGLWGWRYASRTEVEQVGRGTGDLEYSKTLYDSDVSVTTWCVMALKSAQLAKLEVDPQAMAGAMEFCKFATAPLDGPSKGLVGYLDAPSAGATVSGAFSEVFTYHPTTMSALGMCIRIFATRDPNDPFLEAAAKRIVQDRPTVSKDRASIDYYYWYYASLALNQFDGPDNPRASGKLWNAWNKDMVEAILGLQDRGERGCTSGGWIANDRWANYSGTGPLYDTAMNVLTLEVYYRYPNAFGRKRG
jgi:hypothetical protein